MYTRNRGVRAITVWSGDNAGADFRQGFITLRDTQNKLCHDYIPTYFFRPQHEYSWTMAFPALPILLGGVELDFNNSEVFNGLATKQTFVITFYY